jgi:flagellar biosynthesis regulator FlaF
MRPPVRYQFSTWVNRAGSRSKNICEEKKRRSEEQSEVETRSKMEKSAYFIALWARTRADCKKSDNRLARSLGGHTDFS